MCPDLQLKLFCEADNFVHAVAITGVSAAGDVTGGDIGEKVGFITYSFPHVAVNVDYRFFHSNSIQNFSDTPQAKENSE
jgi:hypothetical protein